MSIAYPNIILDGLENGIIIIDDNFTVHYWNLWMEVNTGVKASAITDDLLTNYFSEIDYGVLLRKIKTSLRLKAASFYSGSANKNFLTINRHKVTGSSVNVMQLKVTVTPYIIDENKVMISIYDVSEMEEAKLSLKREMDKSTIMNQILQRDKKIIDNNLMILKMDTTCQILESTTAFCDFFKLSEEQLIGKVPVDFCDIEVMPSIKDDIHKVINEKKTWRGEIKSIEIDGETYWLDVIITPYVDENGEVMNYTAIYHDISDKKRIEELSITDPLTKLYNRLQFNKVIDEFILNHRKNDKSLCIIIIDIDHFKNINDTYGHQAGDFILTEMAAILQKSVRKTDFIARWGGEEFAILLQEVEIDIAKMIAEKIRKNIEAHSFGEYGIITASFGLTQHLSEDTKESFFLRADEALYEAKENGRNRVVAN